MVIRCSKQTCFPITKLTHDLDSNCFTEDFIRPSASALMAVENRHELEMKMAIADIGADSGADQEDSEHQHSSCRSQEVPRITVILQSQVAKTESSDGQVIRVARDATMPDLDVHSNP